MWLNVHCGYYIYRETKMLIILNVAHACLCQLWHNRVHANFGTLIFMPTMAHFWWDCDGGTFVFMSTEGRVDQVYSASFFSGVINSRVGSDSLWSLMYKWMWMSLMWNEGIMVCVCGWQGIVMVICENSVCHSWLPFGIPSYTLFFFWVIIAEHSEANNCVL